MPTLDPSEALIACERALRQLFARIFAAEYGPDWLSRVAPADRIVQWRERRDGEIRRRTAKGALSVPEQDELAYAEFHDLLTIAEKNWEPLSPALGKRRRMLPLLQRFEALRNTVAHSRQLLPFEADLLSGIAGEVRNRVTIYMAIQDPGGEYYPRIESVTDSFGRQLCGNPQSALGAIGRGTVQVQVGDVVVFECAGSDAQGRELMWGLSPHGLPETPNVPGSRSTLRWNVHERDVQQEVRVWITMASTGEFHRHGSYDDAAIFVFTVPPPR